MNNLRASTRVSIAVGFGLLMSGCATVGPVPLGEKTCSPEPCNAVAAAYSTTYFQARYMGKDIGGQLGLIGALVREALIDYDKKHTAERQNENGFEKRLGDFDTAEYFFQRFEERLADSRRITLTLATDPNALAPIVDFVRAEESPQRETAAVSGIEVADSVAALRVAYGLAARAGNEQIGFRKYYRPFIRLNGIVKDARTGQVLWRDSVVAFADKRYLGDAADPENVDPADLVSSFKALTPAVIDLVMRSLNGEVLPPMPELVGTDARDLAF